LTLGGVRQWLLVRGQRAESPIRARWLGEFGALWHSSEKFDRVGWMLASIEYSWPAGGRLRRRHHTALPPDQAVTRGHVNLCQACA